MTTACSRILLSVLSVIAAAVTVCGQGTGHIIVDPDNPAWFVYDRDSNGDGRRDPLFLCGPGGPEGFLYGDFTPGWTQDSIIDYMIENGGNCIYLMAVRSHGGDGDATQNPWIDSDPSKGLNQAVLDQWEKWFTRMDRAGIVIYFIIYDDGVRHIGGDQFIRDIVRRFKHHKHLIWCVAEESHEALSAGTVQHIANIIREEDDNHHPVANHDRYVPGVAQHGYQFTSEGAAGAHAGAASRFTGGYNINSSEDHSADVASVSDAGYRRIIWGTAMGGAYFMQLGTWEKTKGRKPPSAGMLRANRRLVDFFESTDFNTMAPNDRLAHAGTMWVLANPGTSYIAYANNDPSDLGIREMAAGTYLLRWLDCIDGHSETRSVTVSSGDQAFGKPADFGAEVVLHIRRTSGGAAGNVVARAKAPVMAVPHASPAGVNRPPVARQQSFVTIDGKPVDIILDYSDPDGPGPYPIIIVDQPSGGRLTGTTNDRTYTPNAGYVGTDRFTWKVSDSLADSNVATVTISVKASLTGGGTPVKVATGAYPDLAVDKAGNVHLVYARSGSLYYRKLAAASGTWSAEQNTGLATGRVERSDPEIVVDSQNHPHVFCGSSYAYWDGWRWIAIDPGVTRDTAMAIDSKDSVYLCGRGGSAGGHIGLRVRRAGTTSFVSLPDPDVADGLPRGRNDHVYSHIFTSPVDDSVHVVYRHGAPQHLAYRASMNGGRTWIGGGISGDDAEAPSGAVANDGTIHVVSGNGTVFQRTRRPSVWSNLGRAVTAASRDLPALATDRNGNLYVTAFGGKYNLYTGGRWVGEGTLPALSGKPLGFAEVTGGPGNSAYVVWEEGVGVSKDRPNDGSATDVLFGIIAVPVR